MKRIKKANIYLFLFEFTLVLNLVTNYLNIDDKRFFDIFDNDAIEKKTNNAKELKKYKRNFLLVEPSIQMTLYILYNWQLLHQEPMFLIALLQV